MVLFLTSHPSKVMTSISDSCFRKSQIIYRGRYFPRKSTQSLGGELVLRIFSPLEKISGGKFSPVTPGRAMCTGLMHGAELNCPLYSPQLKANTDTHHCKAFIAFLSVGPRGPHTPSVLMPNGVPISLLTPEISWVCTHGLACLGLVPRFPDLRQRMHKKKIIR